MSKKNIIRISFFVVLVLLGFVGYVSMGGLSESELKVQQEVEYLIYGQDFKGSAKTELGKAFKNTDSLVSSYKDRGDLAGFFYTNPSKSNNYLVEVFIGIRVDEKLEEEIDGFEYRTFKFEKSIQGKQDAFFLFSTLYNDIFQYAESNSYVLDSIQAFERYPSENETIIEIPFKGAVSVSK